jgi:hypothetical protein
MALKLAQVSVTLVPLGASSSHSLKRNNSLRRRPLVTMRGVLVLDLLTSSVEQ